MCRSSLEGLSLTILSYCIVLLLVLVMVQCFETEVGNTHT